jgi:beta-N-acetylhexosaminidase
MSSKLWSRRDFLRRTSAGIVTANLAGAYPLLHGGNQPTPRTLREKVAQLFVISFAGTSPSPQLLSLLRSYPFGGFVLYNRNCVTATQTRSLISKLQSASRFPLLIGVDQEGGAVVRVRHGAPVFPSEAVYGEIGSAARVRTDAASTAMALRRLGFTINLAPVVDVLSNSKSPIGTRSYGPNPQLDAQLSVAAIQGYQQHGLAATAKHFIGLGHTSIDSHHALPTVTQSWQQLQRTDLIPFKAAIAAGVSTILVAHVALPRIDPVARPASLSPVIITGNIRGKLGFKGVVMTDSLAMGAVPAGEVTDAPRRALLAGADILLISANFDIPAAVFSDAVDRIISAVKKGQIKESVVDTALSRVLALKGRYPPLGH